MKGDIPQIQQRHEVDLHKMDTDETRPLQRDRGVLLAAVAERDERIRDLESRLDLCHGSERYRGSVLEKYEARIAELEAGLRDIRAGRGRAQTIADRLLAP